MSGERFFRRTVDDAPLYTPGLVPLLGDDCVIEVDLGADPPRVRLEVSLDIGSAELLEESEAFDDFELDPYEDEAVPHYRLTLTLRPEVAAEHAELLRRADDPARAVLRATVGDDAHPPLAMVASYDLEAWQVTTPAPADFDF